MKFQKEKFIEINKFLTNLYKMFSILNLLEKCNAISQYIMFQLYAYLYFKKQFNISCFSDFDPNFMHV